jgi:hypothetical protein
MSHSVVLTWTASVDMPNPIPAGDGYNVYKGTSPGAEGATPINAAPIAANTYTDNAVTVGTYDYYVTAVVNGAQSADSIQVSAVILPAAPTGLSAVAS